MSVSIDRDCPFCHLAESRIVLRGEQIVAFHDRYPVSPGHLLLIPIRHEPDFFQLTLEERVELLQTLDRAKGILDREYRPEGYNVGINIGRAGGQTIMHAHLHLIPRFRGDMDDPRGGVRGVIPEKQKY